MPSDKWKLGRRLKTFWLLIAEDDEFKAACKEAGRDQADVLREAVLMMIGKDGTTE